MFKKETTLKNKSGLHARPASDFVSAAKKFESKITIRNVSGGGDEVNAKSIIRILSEGMAVGTQIEVSAEGADEQAAVEALVALIDSGFGEE